MDDEGVGSVDFLNRELLDSFLDSEEQPEDILEKCRSMDAGYVYDISSRDPETCDPYWFGSTVILQDGFVYFVDDDDMTVDKITSGYCYFKTRHMKYRIIPN